ncbi:cache domain-containing protein [Geomesophilobacter sediminis]|uniref:histidine kinase n=1 Tax=Geomesophilobacter sediminis TaxID=2798584 RepID=A0A8J7LT92_9BACT|nr:cache domain-containing protein [Geomesophilobacter sediminis]MBJ6723119.1 PAS domain-containing protein [Geomesophilobacter sediminis]
MSGIQYPKSMSLKAKMVLAVAAMFGLFFFGALYLAFTYFERIEKESIAVQQQTLVSTLADNIESKLSIAQKALLAAAPGIPPGAWHDPVAAQRFLDERISLKSIFDNNLLLISPQGRIIAEQRYLPGRRGKDLSYRPWFRKTMETGLPYISDPYFSTHLPKHPAVMVTAPIYAPDGKINGLFVGSFDLLSENFLADLAKVSIGRDGYLYLTDSSGIMIVHPESSRIMKPAASGANTLFLRALKGFEGSGETVNSQGVRVLSTFKRLRSTSWILSANFPVSEAYAPLQRAKAYFLLMALPVTGLLMVVTWLIMKRLMAPLAAFTRHVRNLPQKSGEERHTPIASSEEIGVLASAFNAMIDTLDIQREELKRQNRTIEDERAFLRSLIDAIPDMIFFKDRDSVYRGCNESFARHFAGVPKEEVIGRSDYDFAPAAVAEHYRRWDRRTLESGELSRLEQSVELLQGRRILVETIKAPFRDAAGVIVGVIGISHDITVLHEQKVLLEQEVAERKAAQDELALRQLELKELNRSLEERIMSTVMDLRQKDQALVLQSRLAVMGEMINNIAHQWRQPLNNLGLIAQYLGEEAKTETLDPTDVREQVTAIMNTIDYMSRTIDDFRNFFRQDKEKRIFNVSSVVTSVLELINANLRCHDIKVDVQLDQNITVEGYRNEYAQVLLNLLANARDVLVERKVKGPRISIFLGADGDRSVLRVTDNAGGVAEEILPRIYDLYFSGKESGTGSGIGLYMSKVIIEQNMGGALSARNVGQGAEFTVLV